MSMMMKLSVIILYSLTLEKFLASATENELDFFSGPESFVEKDTIIFASCQKSAESFEKVCFIHKYSDIFNTKSSTTCPVILETQRRNYAVGSRIQILPFGNNKAIVKWVEKYEEDPNLQRIYIRFTIIEFGNCNRRDTEISLSTRDYYDFEDQLLDEVHLVTNETDDTFNAILYNSEMDNYKISKLLFDAEGNEKKGQGPGWLDLSYGPIVKFISLKRGNTKFGFLFESVSEYDENHGHFPLVYIVNENGSKILALDLYADFKSTLIYSTDNNFVSICYYIGSSFSCGRFTYEGEAQMKRRFRLKWKVENAAVHYVSQIGLMVFTYSNSESCKDTEWLEHITFINDQGIVESIDRQCRSKSFSMPQGFYNDKNEYCWLEYSFHSSNHTEQIKMSNSCFPVQTFVNILSDIPKVLNTANLQLQLTNKE